MLNCLIVGCFRTWGVANEIEPEETRITLMVAKDISEVTALSKTFLKSFPRGIIINNNLVGVSNASVNKELKW